MQIVQLGNRFIIPSKIESLFECKIGNTLRTIIYMDSGLKWEVQEPVRDVLRKLRKNRGY